MQNQISFIFLRFQDIQCDTTSKARRPKNIFTTKSIRFSDSTDNCNNVTNNVRLHVLFFTSVFVEMYLIILQTYFVSSKLTY